MDDPKKEGAYYNPNGLYEVHAAFLGQPLESPCHHVLMPILSNAYRLRGGETTHRVNAVRTIDM